MLSWSVLCYLRVTDLQCINPLTGWRYHSHPSVDGMLPEPHLSQIGGGIRCLGHRRVSNGQSLLSNVKHPFAQMLVPLTHTSSTPSQVMSIRKALNAMLMPAHIHNPVCTHTGASCLLVSSVLPPQGLNLSHCSASSLVRLLLIYLGQLFQTVQNQSQKAFNSPQMKGGLRLGCFVETDGYTEIEFYCNHILYMCFLGLEIHRTRH